MKAVIYLDVPDWQIGQNVSVYFQDTMMKHDKCELLKEQEAVKPTWIRGKPCCGSCGLQIRNGGKFCGECGKMIAWEGR